MKKLKLDLDRLDVKSFDAGAAPLALEGTVRAHSDPVVATWIATIVTPPVVSYFAC